MTVKYIGNSLMHIFPDLIGKRVTDWFDIVRPLIDFRFQNVRYKYHFVTLNRFI